MDEADLICISYFIAPPKLTVNNDLIQLLIFQCFAFKGNCIFDLRENDNHFFLTKLSLSHCEASPFYNDLALYRDY